jgi:hypothetical protein
MESFFNYTIQEFVVESYDGESFTDLTSCIASVQYYEDLFSPAIFIKLLLVNTEGKLTSLDNKDPGLQSGIKGGERVSLIINQPAFPDDAIKLDETKNTYYIYKTSLSTTEYTREALLVELCPAEVFMNETSRVIRKYGGNIGDSAYKILKEVLYNNQSSEKLKAENIEKTSNSYVFYGNTKKPFTVLTWLGPKSIPTKSSSSPEKGTAGFLFYENKEGYHYKSIDSLMSGLTLGTTDKRNIQKYFYTTPENPASDIQNRTIIGIPTFEKNVNLVENLRIGMYSSVNYFFDVNDRTFNLYKYKLKESYQLMSHSSGANISPPVPLNLNEYPSRLMFRVLDNFNADPAKKEDFSVGAINNEDKTPLYQAASIARYNLAFSQSLNITIPLNLSLTVGDVIELEFPKITLKTEEKGTKDDLKSGYYLIKELSHLFESNQGYTGLKLIRDSYGAPPQ